MNRKAVLNALQRRHVPGQTVVGSGTSMVCQELMKMLDIWFPRAHLEAEAMARLAFGVHTEMGMDIVMPLFSVCHEAAAMGCHVNWGSPDLMPDVGPPIFAAPDDIRIPPDFLDHPACRTPLEAIALLRKWGGDDIAVCGKVFGPWTQAYHYFGVENFLMLALDDPPAVERIIDALLPITAAFAKAQIDAGADCILLGDHATRDLCSPEMYKKFLQPAHARLAAAIPAPVILHICGYTADRIAMIAETQISAFHWDTKTGAPEKVRALAGTRLALMGGISNPTLWQGTPAEIEAMARQAVAAGVDIIGPECAIPLQTPLANIKAIVAGVGR